MMYHRALTLLSAVYHQYAEPFILEWGTTMQLLLILVVLQRLFNRPWRVFELWLHLHYTKQPPPTKRSQRPGLAKHKKPPAKAPLKTRHGTGFK